MVDIIQAQRQQVIAATPVSFGETTVTLAAPAERLSLRAKDDALPGLSNALGLSLPTKPKTSASNGARHALWLGPDEWLVIDTASNGLLSALKGVESLHSATDVSHRNNAFIVKGAKAAEAINAGCPLNLSLSTFPVGACTRTIFGKAEIVLYRTAEDEFRVECWRSFVEFVQGLLIEGAKDASL
jgi:sarcosine oxidase subunit gamma